MKPLSPRMFAGTATDFRQAILPHVDGAYNLARYLTRDPVLSEDVVQDALLRAFRAFDGWRGGSARAWLFAIVRNCCRTALSGRSGVVSLVVDEGEDPAPSPEDDAIARDDATRVRTAIEAIPEPFREAVVLRDLEELSYAEIAEVVGVPVGTVMSRLSRGRTILADALLPASNAGEPTRSVK